MKRAVSIRESLLRDLVIVILSLSAAILAVTIFGTRRAVRELSSQLVRETLNQTEAELEGFFTPVLEELLVVRSWGEDGVIDPNDPESLRRLLIPIMRQFPQVTSMMVADDRGREFMLLRIDRQWRNRLTRADEWQGRVEWLEWTDVEPDPVERDETLDYDPRTRPWFEGAIARAEQKAREAKEVDPEDLVHWTTPYTFFTTKDPGITAAVSYTIGDERTYVIGFDIMLRDISDYTSSLHVTENGGVIVLTDERRIIGLPRHSLFVSAEVRQAALLQKPSEIDWSLGVDASRAFQGNRGAGDVLRFRSEGDAWWGQGREFRLGRDRDLWMAVVIPESDVLGDLVQLRIWLIVITAGVLLAAILRAVHVSRRFSEPIEQLVAQSDQISQGNLDPGEPIVARVSEVMRLAEAHDRMREGLRTLLKLERDIQLARQIQQNTFPDKLPELNGFEITAWSEPADETGGDTYDVIGLASSDADTRAAITDSNAERAVFLLADATGHGIGPALSVTQIRAMLRMAMRMHIELPRVAAHLNDQLYADLPDARFITAWLGELDTRNSTLTTFSAGQGPLLYFEASLGEATILSADAPPFGVIDDLPIEMPEPIVMAPGDIFAVISDGIYEAMDPEDAQFGNDRVIDVVYSNATASPEVILDALRAAVDQFTRGRPATDDRTAIIIKRTVK